ncbi:MAG: 2'-5' RNA ligase [Candidatus Buchananbacteria bacterium RIFCSPHIGHO2_01_FULL_39_14]|uniref:RNA 2',3'-cyclic phosphodiesterase n=1 Tax=Candidatus Buchananbacteria bacterium RIFCSPHIGHO2_01_FULL_39_14 TaxID=1797532 RepID=A0A1G1XWN7_9BACT|nr:MAG: 2'-5' RNA ligase [Candidatus Buchananbacteria bacterium RIFCSPHIGHO2_01_FULL_39_14]OGY48216.1 MAG: 2'-5' RNA ligase [Candidatus Buchananbacteria bacterium RIFCSPHIGHO2_02_FULL_39_17]
MKKRVFIAINLPLAIKEELNKLISRTKKINSSQSIRYVKAKNIHLTLHFLGYLNEDQINQVKNVLKSLAKDFQETVLITKKIDAFPNLNQPRVIFLSCPERAGENLIKLQKNLGENLKKIGIILDHRLWQPHLTLARIFGHCQFKTQNLIIPKLEIPVNSLELMESQLSPFGAEYKVLASYTLK